jgi:hypothetical protein
MRVFNTTKAIATLDEWSSFLSLNSKRSPEKVDSVLSNLKVMVFAEAVEWGLPVSTKGL